MAKNQSLSLLLIPVATLLASCGKGSDIVVKTDLNEEVVVKDSAVTMLDFDWDEAIKSTEGLLKDAQDGLQENVVRVEECSADGLLTYAKCSDIFSGSRVLALKTETDAKANLATLKQFSKAEDPFKQVRYRPIFVDVNGDKQAMSYVTLTCLNPKQTAKEDASLLMALNESIEDVKLKAAYYQAGLKVCQKYAFDEAKVFAYRLSDDTDTEVRS